MRKSDTPPLNIKDPETYRLARKLADQTGETLTETVRKSLAERLKRETRESNEYLMEELSEIAERCSSRPVLDPRSPDEIIGYDEDGLWK